MAAKTAFVFAGAHKTASSALQHACQAHARDLLDIGILYPCPASGFPEVPPNHSFPARDAFSPERWARKIPLRDVRSATRETARELWNLVLSSDSDLLIVAEGICLLPVAGLRDLRTSLERAGYKVKPFFSLRSPASFLRSVIQQQVKGQELTLSNSRQVKLQLYPRLATILTAWPDTTLMAFEKACRSDDGPVGYYLRHLLPWLPSELVSGISITRSSASGNASGTDQAVRLASYLNSIDSNASIHRQTAAQRAFLLRLFRKLAGDPFKLLKTDLDYPSAIEQVADQTKKINDILLDRIANFIPYQPQIEFADAPASWTPEVFSSLDDLLHLCPAEWKEPLNEYIDPRCK
jgi:hypothetical protein